MSDSEKSEFTFETPYGTLEASFSSPTDARIVCREFTVNRITYYLSTTYTRSTSTVWDANGKNVRQVERDFRSRGTTLQRLGSYPQPEATPKARQAAWKAADEAFKALWAQPEAKRAAEVAWQESLQQAVHDRLTTLEKKLAVETEAFEQLEHIKTHGLTFCGLIPERSGADYSGHDATYCLQEAGHEGEHTLYRRTDHRYF